jgi:hypothetical protein
VNTPKPGDFPIGSVESRAAMRFELSNQRDAEPQMEFISYIPRPWRGEGPQPENWNKVPRLTVNGRTNSRHLYVPPNMTDDEARKIVGLADGQVDS